MIYYNRDGESREFDKNRMEYVDHGKCAEVFHDGNIIFKEYYSTTKNIRRLSPDIFDILKDINNEYFIDIFEIYSKQKNIEDTKESTFKIDAYTAKYYEKENINVLYEPTNYLLENFREIERLSDFFSKNQILTIDLHIDNIIINSNQMIIVDPDCFKIDRLNKNLQLINKLLILHLFYSMCKSDILYEKENKEQMLRILSDFVDISINQNTDITYEISKRLKYVKRPIDYFKK